MEVSSEIINMTADHEDFLNGILRLLNSSVARHLHRTRHTVGNEQAEQRSLSPVSMGMIFSVRCFYFNQCGGSVHSEENIEMRCSRCNQVASFNFQDRHTTVDELCRG